MYTIRECKEIMKEIDKIEDERSQRILRNIVLELTEESINKEVLEKSDEIQKEKVDEKEIIKYISDTIIALGIPASLNGYNYIKEALKLTVFDIERLDKITGRLYPDIAKKYNTTSSRVERSIRHAIEVAWSRGDIKLLDDIFGYTIDCEKGRPTNSEFIALISEKIRLKFNM